MKSEKIERFLPHRYPFLLVDRVLELKPGDSILALKNVTYNEPFFNGHFPERKIMPGVLIVEALAQAGGILLYHSHPDPESVFVVLSKIEEAKFRRTVVPGDQLKLSVKMLKQRANFCTFEAKALVEDDIAAEARLVAGLLKKNELDEKI
ncbi:MAG TPA: 3-hydroxyacyl-ACP dehydratase FabZ [Candidatus Saccharicenans sp.]|jgi:3-hydroxyacyl-[acyl-carrier-protein] dehydratase/UDP-3-O-[3-hydroxymyristoyl] N-acetylglucosamine deacetylase/3-hydroxyacyl-[acyl-carrier-protein] dehydratase|nr:3-hydroxyacyl-ACP dehydratase FabZ [Candidatus Saccharicenans sp.]HOM94407.1 3-hydroxyacyl-ACP dehydratase FabZ [Candidatus Saccharicenans sp.]HQM74197.1 3-hydroxyacyl-ACP dehydratase FabZ [Candidatus Saccharicenans sp.]HRT25871.1 3-hydroxyacyl-ACP dehydratase FabZ [Candidatus Saccharicenans sp.]HRV06163.1 3-hydroxyacyl-ACP dehydratase FabZ [Candidatus Saccharicenans sp.]